jgi:hypothetical protein
MLHPGFDVNSFLQVKPHGMHNFFAFGFDLQNGDHVKLLEQLASFRFKLPSIRRILLNLVDDHVKHEPDHVKPSLKLPCSDASTSNMNPITSNFAWNFPAQTRSCLDPGFAFVTCNFLGTFGFALVAKQWWVSVCETCNL